MKKRFFVMMYSQDMTKAIPIRVGDDDDVNEEIMFWETSEKARVDMEDHYFASRFGYEIFEMGTGE